MGSIALWKALGLFGMLRGLRAVSRGVRSGVVRERQPRTWVGGHVHLGTLVSARNYVVVGRVRPTAAGTAVLWRRQLSAKKGNDELVIKVPEMGESINDGTCAWPGITSFSRHGANGSI